MKIKLTKYLKESAEQDMLFPFVNYNNTVYSMNDIKYDNVTEDVSYFFQLLNRYIRHIFDSKILLSIIRPNIDKSNNFIQINVDKGDKTMEIIVNPQVFDKITSNTMTTSKNNLELVNRNTKDVKQFINNIVNFINKR
jgi:hypothetical protein